MPEGFLISLIQGQSYRVSAFFSYCPEIQKIEQYFLWNGFILCPLLLKIMCYTVSKSHLSSYKNDTLGFIYQFSQPSAQNFWYIIEIINHKVYVCVWGGRLDGKSWSGWEKGAQQMRGPHKIILPLVLPLSWSWEPSNEGGGWENIWSSLCWALKQGSPQLAISSEDKQLHTTRESGYFWEICGLKLMWLYETGMLPGSGMWVSDVLCKTTCTSLPAFSAEQGKRAWGYLRAHLTG